MEQKKRPLRWCGWATAVLSVLFVLLTALASWLLATATWEARNWDDLKMDELLYQLSTLTGVGGSMVRDYVRSCLLPGLLAGAAAGLALLWARGRGQLKLMARWGTCWALEVILGLSVYGWMLLDVGGYLSDLHTSSDYIERNYVDPKTVSLEFPEEKRNLIYIWLESMETTFADTDQGGAFPRNVIPELTALARENVCFAGEEGGLNGARSMAGATWTAGALFAHTSGLPLKIPIADSAMDSQDSFFPGVTSLGDILAEQGYQQGLLIGSDSRFGGRGSYFSQHGDYAIWDLTYSKQTGQIPSNYSVWWGYEDEKLFQFAREHLTELAASGQPFHLSLLTVDTHFPDGYVCRLCQDTFGRDQYSNVMACSSRQVAELVAWIQEQPFYENTTIVLCGDHVTMDADYCDDVSPDYPRRVYTAILNPAAQVALPALRRDFTTFDLFPTTLAALGVRIPGERLGLGTNLFSSRVTLLERDGFEEMNQELKRQSDFINALSGIDPEVYQLSERFAATCVALAVTEAEGGLACEIDGVAELEESFTCLELFAEVMEGDTRTTLWFAPAERQEDGRYAVTIPLSEVEENPVFSIHFYGTTAAGRIKIDSGYLYDVSTGQLTREEAA